MLRTINPAAALALGFSLVSPSLGSDAAAAEIRVLSAAVMKPVFSELVDQFEQASRHKLIISYVPAGAARRRVEGGELFDVVIVQRPAAEELVQLGKIDARSITT